MEIAKITTNWQITLPVGIRKKLSLKDGDKVLFMEKDGKIIMDNPAKLAILEAQEAFAGLADDLELKSEEDIVELCKEARKEIWVNNYADND